MTILERIMTMLVNIISFMTYTAAITLMLTALVMTHFTLFRQKMPPGWMMVVLVFSADAVLLCAFLSWFVGRI